MKTRLTELLGIKHPIVQTGMAWVARPEMVAATCNAGGLGILSSASPPDEFRQEIRQVKEFVGGKPFGVNILPTRPGFRRYIQIMLEEEVPVWSSGLRDPFKLAGIKKPEKSFYIPTVGAVRQAVSVEKAGADAVIAQGWEAGGHASRIASMVLIPEVVDAVKIPVIAVGGFSDGRGLAAALALGAEGVAMGTRFATTEESALPVQLKQKMLESLDSDAVLSTIWDGMPNRVIRGDKMKHYRGWMTHFWDVPPYFLAAKRKYDTSLADLWETTKFLRQLHASLPQYLIGMEKFRRAVESGDLTHGYCGSGQVVGRIHDIPTCQELIERVVREAEQSIRALNGKLSAASTEE